MDRGTARRTFLKSAAALGAVLALSRPGPAFAIPSFSAQTGQPCSSCHVGAFGPQLKPYGRDFKLYGYVATDHPATVDENLYERLTVAQLGTFTHTRKDQTGNVPDGFKGNDNFATDETMVFYGGRITPTIGAMSEWTYDGIEKVWTIDAFDVRHAYEGELGKKEYVLGFTFDNQIGNTDIWNTLPVWGFPYSSSAIAPAPEASTFLDDSANGRVMGPGMYLSWDDWLYAEADAFIPTSHRFRQTFGPPPEADDDIYEGIVPYGRVALQHETANHEQYFQAGAFATSVAVFPGGDKTTGFRDRLTDYGADLNYQWMANMHSMVSAHAVWLHENRDLAATFALGDSTQARAHVDELRADATYTFNDTWMPSVQYFRTTGSNDPLLWGSANGSPDSEGYTLDLAYVPFGKPDSAIKWGNARLALEYTGYTKFNGTTAGASDNNTVFLSLWMSLAPLVPVYRHDLTPAADYWSHNQGK